MYYWYVGKTSLLNLLVGDAQPSTGKVSRHLGCRIARLQQHHYKGEQLDPNLTPLVSPFCVYCTILYCTTSGGCQLSPLRV